MFTSEPRLAQRIERMIAETPIIDPHTHIRCDQPNAPDLASLLSDPWVETELRSVGMPADDFDPTLPADERVHRALPYLGRIRNTATAWCLYRIFRDLYDFTDHHVTESNYRDLLDKVAQTGSNAAWAGDLLRDQCNIQTVVTSLGHRSQDPAKNPANVLYKLDAHYLFSPGAATDLEPFFSGRTRKGDYYEVLTALCGERPATPDRLARRLHDWLDRTITGPVRFTSTFLPIEQRLLPPDESETRRVLTQGAGQGTLPETDVDLLVRYVTWQVLAWHHENRKAFQITVGAENSICDGKSIPRYQPNWTSEMARVFHHFGKARFDLLVGSDVMAHEVAVLARQFPNVYVSGFWSHSVFPATIEESFRMRIQMAPMTKLGGFLSDAHYVEWTYGKLQLAKKAIATALAHLVEAGYYDEHELPPILHQVLHDTPRDLYGLGPAQA